MNVITFQSTIIIKVKTYHCRVASCFLVCLEDESIITVLYHVLGHPLADGFSSLSCYSCYYGVGTKIHLKPLVRIIFQSGPARAVGVTMQSGLVCTMIII